MRRVASTAAAILFGAASMASAQHTGHDDGMDRAKARAHGSGDVIAQWPEISRKVAEQMIAQYGQPAGVTDGRLIWHDNGPWKTTIVYRDPVPHRFPMPHEDVLEQVIDFRVPAEKFDELAEYDGSVIVERTKGTMAARCDKEDMNYLALNLAHDVIDGKRSVKEAREHYAETAMAYMNGDRRPYTRELQFDVPSGMTGDPDEPAKKMKTSMQPE